MAKIIYRICRIIKRLHDINIAHGDVHPDNIIFSENADDTYIKISNFEKAIDTKYRNTCK